MLKNKVVLGLAISCTLIPGAAMETWAIDLDRLDRSPTVDQFSGLEQELVTTIRSRELHLIENLRPEKIEPSNNRSGRSGNNSKTSIASHHREQGDRPNFVTVAKDTKLAIAKPAERNITKANKAAPTIQIAQLGIATIFVAPNGNDASNGSQAQPLRTITAALARNLPPGTVIQIAPGTYSAETGETFPLKLTPGLTIRGNSADKGAGIVITGGDTFISPTFARQNITMLPAHNTRIEGVTIINSNSRGYGIWVESRQNVGIMNNTFKDTSHDGIFLTGNAHGLIASNIFTQNKGSGISAVGTSKGEIRNNLFDDTGFGLSIGQKSQVFLIDNRIMNNVDGVIISNVAVPTLRGNLIANSSRNGLVVLKDRNGQPTPDLGTANNPGGNTFQNNQQKDINNVSGVAVVAAGNEFNQDKVAGELDTVATSIPEPIAQLSQPAALQATTAIAAPAQVQPTIPPLPSISPTLPNVAIAPNPTQTPTPTTDPAATPSPVPNPLQSSTALSTSAAIDTDTDTETEILIPLPISPSATAAVKLGDPQAINPKTENNSDNNSTLVASDLSTSAPTAIEPEVTPTEPIATSSPQNITAIAPANLEPSNPSEAKATNPNPATEPETSTEPIPQTNATLPSLTSITIGRDAKESSDPSDSQPTNNSSATTKPSKELPSSSSAPTNTEEPSSANANSSRNLPILPNSPTPNPSPSISPSPTVAKNNPAPQPTQPSTPPAATSPAPVSENVELVKTPLPADVRAQQEGLPPILPGVPTAQATNNATVQPTQPNQTTPQNRPSQTTSLPTTTATRSPAPSAPKPTPSIIYRVLVVAVSPDAVPKLQQIVPTAFSTQHNGQPAVQVGAYGDRDLADQQVSQLNAAGYRAEVVTIRP
ncbi:parallel beta-helix repeat protein [Thalassoporum mexicanum PCC 7367]|uniref:DUF1565 domain-containing protein n=1 Tax=Thalassoporum mexicanum TaxID=3457544 RepID=UPI00029F9DA9|nr:DUF1565 domain-containing protein [Pseudanabaena sp. PCC 7367]AFY70450.1 parallel beta-helix repeat protein [Pseudanabaena sp. PCC 7367]